MARGKPLTKTSLIAALKEIGVATKKDVFKTVREASDAILKGVEEMFEERDTRLDRLESGQGDIKRQLTDFKADVPTQKEFGQLKERVDSYHPSVH
jgi:hypothetical protein